MVQRSSAVRSQGKSGILNTQPLPYDAWTHKSTEFSVRNSWSLEKRAVEGKTIASIVDWNPFEKSHHVNDGQIFS
jgi:hypothetical protein